jgi:hypothetical protein
MGRTTQTVMVVLMLACGGPPRVGPDGGGRSDGGAGGDAGSDAGDDSFLYLDTIHHTVGLIQCDVGADGLYWIIASDPMASAGRLTFRFTAKPTSAGTYACVGEPTQPADVWAHFSTSAESFACRADGGAVGVTVDSGRVTAQIDQRLVDETTGIHLDVSARIDCP